MTPGQTRVLVLLVVLVVVEVFLHPTILPSLKQTVTAKAATPSTPAN